MIKRFRTLLILTALFLLISGFAVSSPIGSQRLPVSLLQADPVQAASLEPAADQLSSLACTVLGDYDNTLEQPEYCVYYNDPPTPLADATLVEDYVEDYWDRYDVDLGFLPPEYDNPPKLEVRVTGNASCNGSAWQNYIKVWDGCFSATNPEFMQYVTGHEIFHRVQFSHDPDWATTWENSGWIYEGTARNMEDVAFANIDTWDNCLGVAFSYCDEVNDYLSSTNNDLTSFGMRYESNLFWTYFREQFGTTPTEPQLGVDALVELWNQMSSAESIAAVNNTLAVLAPGTSFNDVFRQFVVANYTKDLTGLPDNSYNYIDEDQVDNPAPYGPLVLTDGGTINSGSSASWAGQYVSRYGARYYSANPSVVDCPVITAHFNRTGGSTQFYHVITQNGSAFNTHVYGSGDNWTQSFINDGISKVVAIIGGQSASAWVDVELSCSTPVIDIELPNQLAPEYVSNFNDPDNFILQVSVTNGSPTGPVVSGLATMDFKVEVGGIPASIVSGGFVQEEYFLHVDTPDQTANGPYNLEVFLEAPHSSTVVASDLEEEAVVYDATETDHVIITDVSGSMGYDGKLTAAKDAALLFIDATNSSEGLGLVSYNHNVVSALGIEFATLAHKIAGYTQVNGYTADGATSIGDGLNQAVSLRSTSATGNPRCQFTLLSDGMENSSLYWSDVQTAVVDSGCPVMSIAFGPESNELLMQQIATATGGASYYNDVYVSLTDSITQLPEDTELELGDTYVDALCQSQGCERLLSVRGTASTYMEVFTYTVDVDSSVKQLSAAVDWPRSRSKVYEFVLRMISPTGDVFETDDFGNVPAGYFGMHIDEPEVGEWKAEVTYQYQMLDRPFHLMVYGQTNIAVNLLLPAVQFLATGDYVPLFAMWMPGGVVSGTITSPTGVPHVVMLMDDGQHGDGLPGDGFFAGRFTLLNESLETQPVDEGVPTPPAADEGAYRVKLLATLGDLRRESQGAFTVPAGEDSDSDGVPDDYIEDNCPEGPDSDADLDFLNCGLEYYYGTDPNNSDTDGGGESDLSEVAPIHGLDPFDPADDMIEAFDYVHTTAQISSTLLTYDVKGEYVQIYAYRATNPSGPWPQINDNLPLDGMFTDFDVVNGTTYYYCLIARDSEIHLTATVCGEEVTPSEDPVPPEAALLINGGATSTDSRYVLLSFVPANEEHETALGAMQNSFNDIAEVQISNDPSMEGAAWQEFKQDISWTLTFHPGLQTVYVRFKDEHGNESVGTETATIELEGGFISLPLIFK